MKLDKLMEHGGMTEVQALNFMDRWRDVAYTRGDKIVRIIRNGKVVEQHIGRLPSKRMNQ